jgi:DNA-binding NtrC family response regulator
LENAIERAVVLSNHVIIEAEDLPSDDSFTRKVSDEESTITNVIYVDEDQTLTLEELSKKYIRHIFDKNSGAKEQTAKDLGIDRKTLYRKLKEMNIN